MREGEVLVRLAVCSAIGIRMARAPTFLVAMDRRAVTPASTGTYSFSVSVTGCGGNVSTKSYEVVIQATANHVVDLRWNASTSSNITGYNVYRSANETTWSKINDSVVPSTLFSDSTVANGSTYYYALTAVNVSGDESSKTAATKVVIP